MTPRLTTGMSLLEAIVMLKSKGSVEALCMRSLPPVVVVVVVVAEIRKEVMVMLIEVIL